MSKIPSQLYDRLNSIFLEAAERIKNSEISVSDIFLNVKSDDLLLSIADDMENPLLQATIDEWDTFKEEASDFEQAVADSLKEVLRNEKVRQAFESLSETSGPVSVILVDEENEPIEELATFDKDMLFLDDTFLKKIDKELDEFFDRLMSDVK